MMLPLFINILPMLNLGCGDVLFFEKKTVKKNAKELQKPRKSPKKQKKKIKKKQKKKLKIKKYQKNRISF